MNTNPIALEPLWSAEEIYDALMREIEPDLVSETIGSIDTLYPGETEEERDARMKQYALAFVIFDETLEEYELEKKEEIHRIKNEMQQVVEQESKAEDDATMTKIEESIESSNS
jgi:hypothetical protein